jgi:hypothetical protein
VSDDIKKVERVRDTLNAVSPSFCLAKWSQVTVHLQTGHTHSCHHPPSHHIPREELADNPTALHNTTEKKHRRAEMLAGIRPQECGYCWRIEDSGKLSDRAFKSATPWAQSQLAEIAAARSSGDIIPAYMEVSFSHACNFKCSYCGPAISSKWMEEIRQHGPYPTSTRHGDLEWLEHSKQMPIPVREPNPYVDAFWKWWPELYSKLRVFRITGGEPLLTENTFMVLDHVIENPNPDLELAVNTNLCVPAGIVERFAEKLEAIVNGGLVKRFNLFTSVDTHGSQAEYIRHGLDYRRLWDNLAMLAERCPSLKSTIMCTFSALSIPKFGELVRDVSEFKLRHTNPRRPLARGGALTLDTPVLSYPPFMAPAVLLGYKQAQWRGLMDAHVKDMLKDPLFHVIETERASRISRLEQPWPERRKNMADFHRFFTEHDRRRGTNFLRTFPELEEFWESCEIEARRD